MERLMKKGLRAFSLLELLVVVAIMAILSTLAVSAFGSISRSMALTRGGDLLAGEIERARQMAISKNTSAEVRFLRLDGDPSAWGAVQIWLVDPITGVSASAGGRSKLPDAVVISSNTTWSSVLGSASRLVGTMPDGTDFTGFRVRANGATDLPDVAQPTVTLIPLNKKDATALSVNFMTLQIDALTGRIQRHQP